MLNTINKSKSLTILVALFLSFATILSAYEILISDFSGTEPSKNTPWTKTYSLGKDLSFSGWQKGSGITHPTTAYNDKFTVGTKTGPSSSSSLDYAITNSQYIYYTLTVTNGVLNLNNAKLTITIKRETDMHSPRQFALFTSVGGFSSGNQIYTSAAIGEFDYNDYTYVINFPSSGYNGLTGTIEFRIYFFNLRYNYKYISMKVFKLVAPFDPKELANVGYHPGGVSYYGPPYFANAFANATEINTFQNEEWGTKVITWNNSQYNSKGLPKYLNTGEKLRFITTKQMAGKCVLTWTGTADIRLNGGSYTYISAESSGASTGNLTNGRRVYQVTTAPPSVVLYSMTSELTDLKYYLPDPSNPTNYALENDFFYPSFVSKVNDKKWAFIRLMGWNETNASPVQDWSDRRLPNHFTQTGILNTRAPASGFAGNRNTGVAYEYMVKLCNDTNKNMWICIPHLATNDFITKLAQLIRYGSDGTNPYTSVQSNPVYPPLKEDLKVYVEFSNEIWSSGYYFPQGDWANAQATALGITKPQFNARKFCDTWKIFQDVFGDNHRIVKVAAVFTGNQTYTTSFINEIVSYGPTLNPQQELDLIACTTYYGNGIQDWAHQKAIAMESSPTDQWFYTGQYFDAGGGVMRPVSKPSNDSYWSNNSAHQTQTINEWLKRILSGSTLTGGGPDANGIGGGFEVWLKTLADTAYATKKPIIAYEGGPSIYTDYMDGGDSRDDGITTFICQINRNQYMIDTYKAHLNMAKAKGLWTHSMFVDASVWGKYGQWGHLESFDQNVSTAYKYVYMKDFFDEFVSIRHIDDPKGAVPSFTTASTLPNATIGSSYSADISVTGGNGARTITLIAKYLGAGLSYSVVNADTVRISGTLTEDTYSYVYLRVTDADGDPAWRTFTIRAVGGPGVLLETDFTGTNPAQNLPWTAYYYKASKITQSGWNNGSGITAVSGNNALYYSQTMPANEADATLALAITDNEYWTITITPTSGNSINLRKAEVRFTIARVDFHSPRKYALFTSIGGFSAGNEVYTSARYTDTTPHELVFTLPDTSAYENKTTAVEFRIYGFAGQYAGHKTSISSFKVKEPQ